MIAENKRAWAHLDIFLIVVVYALAILGVYSVAVATYSTSSSPDASLLSHVVESSYAMRQGLFVLLSPVILSVMLALRYQWLRRYAGVIYFATVGLVAVVWVFNRATGVKQWLDLFMGYTVQPTEFAKLAIILLLARELSKSETPMSTVKDFIRLNLMILIPGAIITLSGETGSFVVIAFIYAIMLFFGKVKFRVLAFMAGVVILGALALYAFAMVADSQDYRLMRIVSFFNPEAYASSSAYQQTQSMMAIGSGGLTGVGSFVDGALYQLNYVPADWTDFIYATIGEAFGFVGCLGVLVLYLLMVLRMFYLARYTRDRFGMLVIIGVAAMFLFHVMWNIGMTIGRFPITGIPLPFLSYGGSNMFTNMAGIGLVLNVTRNRSLTGSFSTPQQRVSVRKYAGQ